MPSYERVEYAGFSFLLLLNDADSGFVLINDHDPVEDPIYLKSLQHITSILPYFQAVAYIAERGLYEYDDLIQSRRRNSRWVEENRASLLMTIEAYEKKIVPVREHVYRIALALQNNALPPLPPKQTKQTKQAKQAKQGYVYLLRSASGHYKIGRTLDPQDRAKTFNVKLPFEVEYLHLIKCNDYETVEKRLHEHFASRHVNGEWFALTDEDVEYIKGLDE